MQLSKIEITSHGCVGMAHIFLFLRKKWYNYRVLLVNPHGIISSLG
jgi:hypothetical protein